MNYEWEKMTPLEEVYAIRKRIAEKFGFVPIFRPIYQSDRNGRIFRFTLEIRTVLYLRTARLDTGNAVTVAVRAVFIEVQIIALHRPQRVIAHARIYHFDLRVAAKAEQLTILNIIRGEYVLVIGKDCAACNGGIRQRRYQLVVACRRVPRVRVHYGIGKRIQLVCRAVPRAADYVRTGEIYFAVLIGADGIRITARRSRAVLMLIENGLRVVLAYAVQYQLP